jgi:hypothetical protein
VLWAAAKTVSASSGLTTGTLTTLADTPAVASTLAAVSAAASIIPLAISATSSPSVSTCAWVSENSWSSSKITGISPRFKRK